jgi:hypothetical protein
MSAISGVRVSGLFLLASIANACPNESSSLAQACPELLQKLDAQGLVAELGINTAHQADVKTVANLQSLLDLAADRAELAPIDEKNLELVRNQHYEAQAHLAPGMWEQFLAWWASIFDSNDDSAFDASFWSQFAPSVLLAKILFFAISLLLVVMCGYFLWREFKPVWQARTMRRKSSGTLQDQSLPWPPSLDPSNPARALSQFFSGLVRRLGASGLLPKNPALTHLELSAQFDASARPGLANTFTELSLEAQSALFANQPVSALELQSYAERSTLIIKQTEQIKGSSHA